MQTLQPASRQALILPALLLILSHGSDSSPGREEVSEEGLWKVQDVSFLTPASSKDKRPTSPHPCSGLTLPKDTFLYPHST